jgi:hypothetical protein
MLMEGVMLGTMTTLGFILMYGKMPPWIQEFMKNHPVITEIALVTGFYLLMGMSVTAHFAVGAMVLQVQAALYVARNPDDFLFLQDAKEKAKKALSGVFGRLKSINEEYRNSVSMRNNQITVEKIS